MRGHVKICPHCGSEWRAGVRFCGVCGGAQTQTPQHLAAIRALLVTAFTPETLYRFCFDRPLFRPVINSFGRGHSLNDMIDVIFKYCRTRLLWNELLDAVEEDNPRQFAYYAPMMGVEPKEQREAGPPKPRPMAKVPGSLAPAMPAAKDPGSQTPARPVAKVPKSLTPAMPDVLTITSPFNLTLVLVPAGEFLMGSDRTKDKHAEEDEEPQHAVDVADFYIAKNPVTQAQFDVFCKACKRLSIGTRLMRGSRRAKKAEARTEHPAVGILWEDAIAFCNWLSKETAQTVRLPTEAEWEKAARGGDGRIYPWGDDWDRTKCNTAKAGSFLSRSTTSPVGQYSPEGDSPYGSSDMVGNVWEWCQSLYRPYPYKADDGRETLEADGARVVRGGSWSDTRKMARCACRSRRELGLVAKALVAGDLQTGRASYGVDSLGFRVVVEPAPPGSPNRGLK